MAESIHVARWIKQLEDCDWDLHLFPSRDVATQHWNSELTGVTVHTSTTQWKVPQRNVKLKGWRLPPLSSSANVLIEASVRKILQIYRPQYWHKYLASVINRVQPDVIHIIEFQHGGYLMLDALPYIKVPLPKIILTNWGNDIYFFSQIDEHLPKIKKLLALADYYDCECERDIELARDLGFSGIAWPPFPNTGGHHLDQLSPLRALEKPSERKIIMLKGYQHWQGRALFALKGLELISDLLQGYKIVIFSFKDDVELAAQIFSKRTGIEVEFVNHVSHEMILQLFSKARIYLCSNVTDGLNTAFGEAIVMGAFPVITGTACVDEWIQDGESGLIIRDAESPEEIANALRRAITDDTLVNKAAELNWETAKNRLEYDKIRDLTIDLYKRVMEAEVK